MEAAVGYEKELKKIFLDELKKKDENKEETWVVGKYDPSVMEPA